LTQTHGPCHKGYSKNTWIQKRWTQHIAGRCYMMHTDKTEDEQIVRQRISRLLLDSAILIQKHYVLEKNGNLWKASDNESEWIKKLDENE